MGAGTKVTQKDVARAANVHPSTVSLALSNSAALPENTRKRICDIADKLGYRPDPFLSQLAVYRKHTSKDIFRGILAFFVYEPGKPNWREISIFKKYFEGAAKQAKRHGYLLEIFELDRERISPNRIKKIMQTKGVKGLLLCPPSPRYDKITNFGFSEFSCISLGSSTNFPRFHTVTHNQYQSAQRCMESLIQKGCHRIGFAIPKFQDDRVNNKFLAAYLVALSQHSKLTALPQLPDTVNNEKSIKAFTKWYHEVKPDGLLTVHYWIPEFLAKINVVPGQDCQLAVPCLPSSTIDITGILENGEAVGAAAVDKLVAMIWRGEIGIPHMQQVTSLEGVWVEGSV